MSALRRAAPTRAGDRALRPLRALVQHSQGGHMRTLWVRLAVIAELLLGAVSAIFLAGAAALI